MKDISVLVGDVRKKVERLIEKHTILTKSNEKLSSEVIKIKDTLAKSQAIFLTTFYTLLTAYLTSKNLILLLLQLLLGFCK